MQESACSARDARVGPLTVPFLPSQEAVKREVKEESGLDFEPETLLSVECQSYSWVRFTLGGRIVGGQLKTVAQADKESLQAQWHPVDKAKLLQTVRSK